MPDDNMSVSQQPLSWEQGEIKAEQKPQPLLGQMHGHDVKHPSDLNTNNAAPTPSNEKAAPTKKLTIKERIKGAHSDALSYVTKTFPKPVSKIVHFADKVFVGILKAVKEEAQIWGADLLTETDWPPIDEGAAKVVGAGAGANSVDAGEGAKPSRADNIGLRRGIRPTYGTWDQTAKKANRDLGNTPPLLSRWENALTEQLGGDSNRILDEKSTNKDYQAAVSSAIKDLQKAYDKAKSSYTVQGGFSQDSNGAVEVLKKRSADMWANHMVQHQELSDAQIDADAGRSVTKVGSHPATTGEAAARAKSLRENLTAEIKLHNPGLSDEDVSKVQRFMLERLDETNTNMELMAAVSLGFGNRDLIVVQPDTDDPLRVDVKQAEVKLGQIQLTVPSRWNINENTQNTQSINEKPHTFGKVEATYVLNVSIDDILKDVAKLQVPDITVTKVKK
ncbi:MAG: hypothetical protein Q8K75_11270 [Chlamydiales bacterium]|nr:hypothetical protein [Chlamydiales bacterium]